MLALSRCTPEGADTEATGGLDPGLLRALSEVILPTELGEEGRELVTSEFVAWLKGYEPVPELMHSYGSQEIRYGPGDPAPRWASQLAAMDLEAHKRWGMGFGQVGRERRQDMVRRQLRGFDLQRLPAPIRAEHVATALLSYWLATPEATNRCYGRAIDPRMCRPLAASPEEPARLGEREV